MSFGTDTARAGTAAGRRWQAATGPAGCRARGSVLSSRTMSEATPSVESRKSGRRPIRSRAEVETDAGGLHDSLRRGGDVPDATPRAWPCQAAELTVAPRIRLPSRPPQSGRRTGRRGVPLRRNAPPAEPDMIAVYGHRDADHRWPAGHRRERQDGAAGGYRERVLRSLLLLSPGARRRRLLPRLHRQDREDAEAADGVLDDLHRRHGRDDADA